MNRIGNKGATTLLIALAMAGVIAILISTILSRYSSLNIATSQTKSSTEGQVAVTDLAQVILQGYQEYSFSPTCPSGKTPSPAVRGKRFCIPTGTYCAHPMNQSTNPKYCFSTNPIDVTAVDDPAEENFIYPLNKNISHKTTAANFYGLLVPQAFAQNSMWLPTLSSPPSVTIRYPACDAPVVPTDPKTCVRCRTVSGSGPRNADCFKVKICLNGSNTCNVPKSFIEPVFAFLISN